jgi:hypothetical protein
LILLAFHPVDGTGERNIASQIEFGGGPTRARVDLAAKKKPGAAPNRNAWSTSPAPKRLPS